MACGCSGAKGERYTWTSADGGQRVTNLTIVQAKTRKNRMGGSYTKQ